MSFKMRCPKCSSMSYTIERDTRTYTGAKSGEMVFSCRCGKQLFGEALDTEHLRQKNLWEADPERQREEREREERRREIEQREEQLKKAFEYRKAWVAQKRAEQEAARQGQAWTPPATQKPAAPAPAVAREPAVREAAAPRERASKAQPAAESATASAPTAGSGRAQAADPGSLVAGQASERLQLTPGTAARGDRAVERTPDASPTVSGTQGDAVVQDPGRAPGRKPAARQDDEPRARQDAQGANDAADESDASTAEPGSEMCLWEGCGNLAAPNSKYCSRACSNKNARHRHAQRKKGDQAA